MSKIEIKCVSQQLRTCPAGIAGVGRLYYCHPKTALLHERADFSDKAGVYPACAERFLKVPSAFVVAGKAPPPRPPKSVPVEDPGSSEGDDDSADPKAARQAELEGLTLKALKTLAQKAGLKAGRLDKGKVVDLILAAEYPED